MNDHPSDFDPIQNPGTDPSQVTPNYNDARTDLPTNYAWSTLPPLEPPIPALEQTQPNRPVRRHSRWWREALQLVIVAVVIYVAVNVSTARASIIGPSMRPNFETGQVVIVNRLAYVFSPPGRGDVVVVENPADRCKVYHEQRPIIPIPFLSQSDPSGDCDDLFKRVIGLPGETVEAMNGHIYINGVRLNEDYIKNPISYTGKWVIAPNQFFVLGDNRPSSYDSHNFGAVDRSLIYGRAMVRYWPLQEVELIPKPDYAAH
jgi:signal peptidase I